MLKPTIVTILLLFLLVTFNGPVAFYLQFAVIFIYGATYGQKTAGRVIVTKEEGKPDRIHFIDSDRKVKLNDTIEKRLEFQDYRERREELWKELKEMEEEAEIMKAKNERGNIK